MSTRCSSFPCVLLHPDARPPSQAYEGDAGFDLVSVEAAELASRAPRLARLRHRDRAAPRAPAASCCRAPGLARDHGVTVVNSPGLVDSGYRGELRVTLLNTDRDEAFQVEPGMRIAQLVVVALPQIAVIVRDELAASARGEQGFGSSGRA